ncbi:unnamed protein product [Rotaria socialis]|uniref:Uncharacterized protein n=1 Tax=Rotaria socialis TaxID=392032 RepID=A0A821DXR6_9BILA|nr:unnamed protein product [Rotaria socialis]
MVTFEYHNVERRILLHRDVPLREIHDILKSDFGLPASASLLLFNIVGNYSVCGSTAGILWALNDAKVPKYRIVVGGETSKVYMLDESYLLFPMFEYSRFRILNRFQWLETQRKFYLF